jgi:hypothetical protein
MDDLQKEKNVYDNVTKVLKGLSFNDFLNFGMGDFAYVKPIVIGDQEVYSIHAANGNKLSIQRSYNDVVHSLEMNELHGVTVH